MSTSFEPARWEVFLSFCREDERHARALHEELALHCRVFFSEREFAPGAAIYGPLEAAIEAAPVFVSLVSSFSPRSSWWKAELAHHLHLARRDPERYRLLAILLEPLAALPFGISDRSALRFWEIRGHQELAFHVHEFVQGTMRTRVRPPVGPLRFPIGPRVPTDLVPPELAREYAAVVCGPPEIRGVLETAARQMRDADPGARPLQWHEVDPADAADSVPELAPVVWDRVFRRACLHGPRMLGTLLEVVPLAQLSASGQSLRTRVVDALFALWARGPDA